MKLFKSMLILVVLIILLGYGYTKYVKTSDNGILGNRTATTSGTSQNTTTTSSSALLGTTSQEIPIPRPNENVAQATAAASVSGTSSTATAIVAPQNWYEDFIFKDQGFVFELIRTLGSSLMGGSDLGECISTARNIKANDINSWYTEWLKTADRINTLAKTMQAEGHTISAQEAFLRASNYYRTAGFYAVSKEDRPKGIQTWEQSRAAFIEAFKTMPNTEMVKIPYEKTQLPGYYIKATVDSKNTNNAPLAPLLIIMTGFDGTAEELYFEMGFSALKRGYNVLLFEGPGQGEMIMKQNIPYRPDWEVVMKSVLDFAVALPNINQDQIALIGYSMGGYFAPRGCAFESRIKACIADGGVWDLGESVLMKIPKEGQDLLVNDPKKFDEVLYETMKKDITVNWFFNNGMWRFQVNTPSELVIKLKEYTLKDVAKQIKMPTLIIESESDTLLPGQAKKLFEAISGPKDFRLFTKEETAQAHCQEGALGIANEVILNWLDKTFSRI